MKKRQRDINTQTYKVKFSIHFCPIFECITFLIYSKYILVLFVIYSSLSIISYLLIYLNLFVCLFVCVIKQFVSF